jgi:tetratricopeptide (TPR) repeat protein
VPEIEAPEIEVDDDAPAFRRRLALVVVLITLFGAVVAYLHEQNSNSEDNAAREAQIQAIQGFGKQVNASTQYQFDRSQFVDQQLLLRRIDVAASRQRVTDPEFSAVYSEDQSRLSSLHDTMSDGAAIKSFEDDSADFAKSQLDPDVARLKQQVFAAEANDYGNKADAYVALLTVLAVGVFLIGLSLTVSGRGRYLLAIPGICIAGLCVVWAVFITTGSITKVPDDTITLTAQGQQKEIAAPVDADGNTDYSDAIATYKKAIAASPSFGPAYTRLSGAEFENGVHNSEGAQFESVSDTDATKRAIAAGEKAISLGESNPSLLSSVGFYHFTLGEYGRAEELSQQALDNGNEIEPLIFNLGVAQAAQNEKSAARKTYDHGISVLRRESDSKLRQQVAAAALTDLEIAETKATSAKPLIEELKGKLVDAEFQTDTDAGDVSVDNVQPDPQQHKMTVGYDVSNADDGTKLTNVWYFRPLGADGKGPFIQDFNLDSVSEVSGGSVTSEPKESFQGCLPGGDYRVEVYAGSKLVGSNNDKPFHFADSPIGKLELFGGESDGVQLCAPAAWEFGSTDDGSTLSLDNPQDTSQSVRVFAFLLSTSFDFNTDPSDSTAAAQAGRDKLTNVAAPTDGVPFVGRPAPEPGQTAGQDDFPLDTREVIGTTPSGGTEAILVSFDEDDFVMRVTVLTGTNQDDVDRLGSEIINSIRFLDVPKPSSNAGG